MGVICKAIGRVSKTQDPCVFVDPFAGTATTAITALLHSCHFIGCENANRCHKLAHERINEFDKNLIGSELFENIQERKEEEKVCCVWSVYVFYVCT